MATAAEVEKALVFLCAADQDGRFLEELKRHLQGSVPGSRLHCFASRDVPPGQVRAREIEQAAKRARVAVVLVSAELLSGEAAEQKELKLLWQQWQMGRLTLIPVLARACSLEGTPFAKLKFVDQKSCAEMKKAWRDKLWVRVAEVICAALETGEERQAEAARDMSAEELEALCARVEERYRRALLEDRSLTLLQVLGMRTAFPIEQIYIRLRLHEEPESRYLSAEERGEQFDPLQVMQRQWQRLERRFSEALEPQEAIRRHPRCVILGDPGAGKTTLLRHLAICILRGEGPDLPPVPIYLSLNAFAASDQKDLLSYAAWRLARDYGDYELEETEVALYLRARLEAGKTLFLLDGLDETLIGESAEEAEGSYRRVVEAVQRLANRSAVVVTARRAGYRLHRRLTGFDELDVLDFREQEIEQFIKRWFLQEGENRAGIVAEGERLLRELRQQPHLLTLAANPLLLTLIVLVYRDSGELPARRAALYKECVALLLERWDRERNIRRMGSPLQLRPDHHRHLLYELAWHMHVRGWRYAPRGALEEWIANFLPRLWHFSGPDLASQVLKSLSDDCGLLREQGQDLYGFLHLTLQEYCAACYVSESGKVEPLLPYLGDPWWEEVTLLYAGAVSDATPLFRALLKGNRKAPPEDLFQSKLLLAGRCLLAQPLLQAWPELRRELPNRLFDELRRTPYRLMQNLLSRLLVELGSLYSKPLFGPKDSSINDRIFDILKNKKKGYMKLPIFNDYIVNLGEYQLALSGDDRRKLEGRSQRKVLESVDDTLPPHLQALQWHWPIAAERDRQAQMLLTQMVTRRTSKGETIKILSSLIRDNQINIAHRCKYSHALLDVLYELAPSSIYDDIIIDIAYSALYKYKTQIEDEIFRVKLESWEGQQAVEILLSLVRDERLPSVVRRICVDGLQIPMMRGIELARTEALAALMDSTLNSEVRAALAFLLGRGGERGLGPQLHALWQQEQNEQLRAALLMALICLDEPDLLEQAERLALRPHPVLVLFSQQSRWHLVEVYLAKYLVKHSRAETLEHLLKRGLFSHESSVLALMRFIEDAERRDVLPVLLKIMEQKVTEAGLSQLKDAEQRRLRRMAITLSELGETPDVAERLLALFQRIGVTASPAGAELHWLSDELFVALWHVTRRTGLLVVEQPRGSRRYVLRPRRGSTAPTVSPLSRGSGQTGRARGETAE